VFLAVAAESIILVAIGVVGLSETSSGRGAFYLAIMLLVLWALVSAMAGPLRQAFLNGIIPSEQRATVLSFASLMGSIGGAAAQPALGRVADVSGYAASYMVSGAVSALALPFILLARREKAPSDPIHESGPVST
jgi:MFS family permease